MSQNVQTLLNETNNLENVSLSAEALAAPGNIICTAWPTAKPLLEAVRDMVKNPIVKISITAIITLIDGIYKKNCQGA